MKKDFKANDIHLVSRQVKLGDEEFLWQADGSICAPEMALMDWIGQQKEAFFRMQFNVPTTHYKIFSQCQRTPSFNKMVDRSIGCLITSSIKNLILIRLSFIYVPGLDLSKRVSWMSGSVE